MTGHKPNILGSELAHTPTFRDDVSNELMTFLQAALLVGLVRIAVKNASTPFSIGSHLDRPWILELRTVVGEYDPESLAKDYRTESIIKHVENILNRLLRTGWKQKDQHE